MTSDSNELRSYEDPESKKFLEEMHRSEIPTELRTKYRKGLEIALNDQRNKNFKKQ